MRTENYKEGFVCVSEIKIQEEKGRKWRCPICGNEIELDNECYLLIDNNDSFPNCIIHKHCYNKEKPVSTFWGVEQKAIMYRAARDMF